MSPKHPAYRPQQRPPREGKIQPPNTTEVVPVVGYEDLFNLLEVTADAPSENPSYLFGAVMSLHAGLVLSSGETRDRDDLRLAALLTAKYFIDGTDLLKELEVDLTSGRDAFSKQSIDNKVRLLSRLFGLAAESTEQEYADQLKVRGALSLAAVFSGNKRLALSNSLSPKDNPNIVKVAKNVGIQIPPWLSPNQTLNEDTRHIQKVTETYEEQRRRIFGKIALNPSQGPRDHYDTLMRLVRPETRAFIDRELELWETDFPSWQQEHDEDVPATVEAMNIETFAGQLLDYTILPEGELRDFTNKLFEGLSDADKARIDLRRVEVLKSLREHFGADNCHYVRGKPRKTMNSDDGEQVNEEYIGLVIKHYDENKTIIGENVIVVSPVENKHAGYIARYDYSTDIGWRIILASPKHTARKQGARPLKFTSVAGMDKYDAYVQKAITLLTCDPNEFGPNFSLRLTQAGEYVMRLRPYKTLGEMAMRIATAE
jgi:ribosomal protein S17E